MKRRSSLLLLTLLTCVTAAGEAQSSRAKVEGMWSDPPSTTLGALCFFSCTDVGIDRLNKLLDDPANDSRPTGQLIQQAKTFEREYLRARLTPAGLKPYPLDPLKDPGYLRCEPWGLARQMYAPHQLEIRREAKDRVVLRYGEWAGRRTVYTDGRKLPANPKPSPMGYSIGHWEGDTLVIETLGIQANIAEWPDSSGATEHSDQLRITERYTRAADGMTLLLTATMEDPWSLREPVVLKKIWKWAPDQKITPYDSCEKPEQSKKGAKP